MNRVYLTLDQAKDLLQEGDVLFYRGSSWIAWFIKRFGEGNYSHVAVASKPNGHWEVLQMKEFRGAVIWPLHKDISKYSGNIDIFRPVPYFKNLTFNKETNSVESYTINFDGRRITNCMREMSGNGYGYLRILLMWLFRIGLLQFFVDVTSDKKRDDITSVVCSTAVSQCFSNTGYDLIPNRADRYIDPSMMSRSPLLNYLFTLTKE
jgi:hypothetical protein